MTDRWFTALSEGDEGFITFISGRLDIDDLVASHRYADRVEVSWTYQADAKGLPADDSEAQQMEVVGDLLRAGMERDKLAVLTGVYTGEGQRVWVYIVRRVDTFTLRLNQALADRPMLPITLSAEHDPDNQEYLELLELRGAED